MDGWMGVKTRGGFHKAICALHFRFTFWAHPFFHKFTLHNLLSCICLAFKLLHFLPALGAFYALRQGSIFMKSTPGLRDWIVQFKKFLQRQMLYFMVKFARAPYFQQNICYLKNGAKFQLGFWLNQAWGGFHKSWVHGVKRTNNSNLGENAISWAQGANAWC
jgi:hypothetical protein